MYVLMYAAGALTSYERWGRVTAQKLFCLFFFFWRCFETQIQPSYKGQRNPRYQYDFLCTPFTLNHNAQTEKSPTEITS